MPNTLVSSSVVAKEFALILHSTLHVVRNLDTSWNKLFGKSFGSILPSGATVSIPKPSLVDIGMSWPLQVEDIEETSVSLTINQPFVAGLQMSDAEESLTLDDISRRIIAPAAMAMAAKIDAWCAEYMVKNTYNAVGNPGTSPNSATIFLQAKQLLNEYLAPANSRKVAVIEPQCEVSIVAALAGQYNPQPLISSMFEKGMMPNSNALGLEWYMSQVIPAHTCGTRAASSETTVASAPSEGGSSMAISGSGSKTYKKGDVFTVANVYNVNYETKSSTGTLKQFVVTDDLTLNGGSGTLKFSPAVYASGAKKNVTALPQSSAAVTFMGTASASYKQELVFVPSSYAVAFANLPLPANVDAAAESYDGISVRVTKDWDINNARSIFRIDAFVGIAAVRPEHCCRVFGA